MAKAKRRAAPVSQFDGEALGLVLFALGIFLGVTVFLPQPEAAPDQFMGQARALLLSNLGWAAWLLPVVPVAYGTLVFLGRDLRNLTRRVLGGAVVVVSLLALHEVAQPGQAGELAARVMGPLHAVLNVLSALLPLITLTLGAELMLRLPPFTLLKGFFRHTSVLLGGGAAQVQGALEARQGGRESARARTEARQGLSALGRELDDLRRLRPEDAGLRDLQQELRAASREVRGLDTAGLKNLERDLAGWRTLLDTFVGNAARDLREEVAAEAPEAGALSEAAANEIRAGRHELSTELPSTQACGALERWRRALVAEAQRLAVRAGRLERERKAAEKALNKADSAALAREWPAHRARREEWTALAREVTAWRGRAAAYSGWPELTAAFDRAPTEVATQLADALSTDPEGTLIDPAGWRAVLAQAQEEARRRVEAMTMPVSGLPALDFDFTSDFAGAVAGPSPESATAPLWSPPAGARAAVVAPPVVEQADEIRPLETPHLDPSPDRAAPAAGPRPPAITRPAPVPTPMPTPDPDLGELLQGAPDGMDPFSGWEDDDLPFGPPASAARPAAAPTAPWESSAPEKTVPKPTTQLPLFTGEPNPSPRPVQGALPLARPDERLLDPIPAAALNTAALDISARQRAGLIDETLRHFNLQARVVDYARGPTVTRYEIEPAPGEKISRIAGLSNDLARALAVGGVRVEAPVPGKSVIGLEVPNAEREPVTFHQAADAPSFKNTRAKLPIILGKSIDGELMVGDLAKMPHLLVAGSTGSGKSVCVNTLITSLLFKYLPTELRFLMIDPKMVELTPYDGIPHLVRGVVTNPVDAAGVLLGAVAHMERRYKMMSQVGAKNLEQFNAKMRQVGETELPHLVIIIDELADLMITSPKEVESAIMRLAQMARATGMHLVLATQRPSVDILTSLIKVNVPARIAFAVSSSHDSRTILDALGAERLTGMGDMLFYQPGLIKPVRLQGPYISEVESARIADELRRQVFEDTFVEAYGSDFEGGVEASGPSSDKTNMDFSDPLLRQAAQICIEEGQGSVSRLQRRLSVGHARAGKLMDMLEAMKIVSKHQGSKPREVLITEAELPEYFGR
ncbi:FtsK/SpoIIIE family DNA translocase [Deinococcus multiflagellatus]|uniref:FtsK/SpoIIIE family DNA translocase n=1 Tax=Deinococcus multiflagellatus TaxID=1656887 RepID=UPI001CCD965D|nr:DNA translocase FtsK [Deinococcus multiflagellatus]MBZ9712076.1 cell division protein FtsK [Deinococcus multiflagellatus]